jgi:hypothetical protein
MAAIVGYLNIYYLNITPKALSLNPKILQYGGLVRYLNYYLTMIRHSKELAEAFGYRTHN